jgi:hypothetical protein
MSSGDHQPPPSPRAVPPAGYATPHAAQDAERAELLTTTVQAIGELADVALRFVARALRERVLAPRR